MPNEKDPRVILPMPRDLLAAVDDFRFANRIESRAEAVRLLLRRGLGLQPAAAKGAARAKPAASKRPARRQA
jgi:metal-responsive CopG/Arc/MetJ family transcriptional regulator